MYSDYPEAHMVQLRQQRPPQQSKAEKRGSRDKASLVAGSVPDAGKAPILPMPGMSVMTDKVKIPLLPMPGMSVMTDEVKVPILPMPGMSSLILQPGGHISTTPQRSTGAGSAPDEQAEIGRRSAFVTGLFSWTYRVWLAGTTMLLTLALFELQSVLDHVHRSVTLWRTAVQWAELSWLMPVPLALILWLGWFLFAEAMRDHPVPIEVPVVASPTGLLTFGPVRPVRLVFRLVTRGDNVEVLRDSVRAIHRAFARYPSATGPYRIEIITEHPVYLNMGSDSNTRIYVVPHDYATPQRSKFKARALTYLQSQVRPQHADWLIYLDEESLVDEQLLAGLYRFVRKTLQSEAKTRKKQRPAGIIGQGAILYQGGNWFFRGADALRTADDLGRFRLQYALGVPMFGVHGSYIVIRGTDDRRLSFDVGAANSITEDAAWALRAWSQGYRFAWVEGQLHEQPPQRAKDFVRQRSRWLTGIRLVIHDKQTPLRYRLCLGLFTALWQLSFLPFLIATAAFIVHASPFFWMRLPADFAWATFFLGYLQGIDVQAKQAHPFLKKGRCEAFCKRVLSWPLVLCSIWYALLEVWGVLYSLKPKQGFFVIQKPSLVTEHKGHPAQGRPAPPVPTANV